MKIVRITLSTDHGQFFVDRAYEVAKNDFENCDMSMKWLSSLYSEGKVHPCMKIGAGLNVFEDGSTRFDPFYGATPALLNLNLLGFINVDNVGVYDVTEKPQQPQQSGETLPQENVVEESSVDSSSGENA